MKLPIFYIRFDFHKKLLLSLFKSIHLKNLQDQKIFDLENFRYSKLRKKNSNCQITVILIFNQFFNNSKNNR